MASLVAVALLSAGPGRAGEPPARRCLMEPVDTQIAIPRRGLMWAKGYETQGRCDPVPERRWVRGQAGASDLLVDADGPSGSGRYWNVTIGLAARNETRPSRGVCLLASTVGWRTLQRYKPLMWLADINADGVGEIVLWDSFPLRADSSLSDHGLVGWVYGLNGDSLSLDRDLTRRLANELAAAYRSRLPRATANDVRQRERAADALERFADGRCRSKS